MDDTGNTAEGLCIEMRLRLPGHAADTGHQQLAAYLFTSHGQLLRQTLIGPYGLANLRIPGQSSRRSHLLMIGPALDEPVSPLELRAHGAWERMVEPLAYQGVLALNIEVPAERLRSWRHARCLVRGLLIGRTSITGEKVEAPIAGAIARVYRLPTPAEVVAALPDSALDNLRAILGGWGILEKSSVFDRPMTGLLAGLEPGLRTELLAAALSAESPVFRALLVEQAPGLREVLGRLLASCRPIGLDLRLVATARSDEEGRFVTSFLNPRSREGAPDLYFTASQPLSGGLELSLYRPRPLNRHVHWQYRSGDEVELYCRNHLFRAPHRMKAMGRWLVGGKVVAPAARTAFP